MTKKMLIDAVHPEEMRVVITDGNSNILDFDFTTVAKQQVKGNVYLAKVTRVEPSLQAAFVEYGGNKQGFLPFSEIHPDYYQIPVSDRKRLIEEEEAAAAAEEEELEKEMAAEAAAEQRSQPVDVMPADAPQTESVSSEVIPAEIPYNPEVETGPAEGEQAENANSDFATPSETDSARSGDDRGEFRRRRRRRRRGGGRREEGDRDRERGGENNGDEDTVETLNNDEEVERPARKPHYSRRYKIQEVIKRNQIMLVQVTKEERGNKGVSLSTFMSLAGRYCVLMPNSPRGGGISRKISSRDDRKKLKKVISDLELPKGMSVIVRTAGADRTRTEIKRDFDYLVKLWNQIREDTLASSAPALIYEESNLIKRTIRDSYNNDIETILVEGENAYKEAKAFMRMLVPSHAPRVKQYKGSLPLFHKHHVENHLLSMYEPVVKLHSGGYLVLNPTEALISIDVNSGRATTERNVEETAVKTNTEAAKEIARQLKLRDLAGLIVIDFIDMMDGKNRRKIERALKEALRHDRARIQVGRISPFGLLEMSRQRLRPSISESVNLPCPHCNGSGHVRSDSSVAIQVIRDLEKEAGLGSAREFRVWVTPSIATYMLNNMHNDLHHLQETLGIILTVQIDDALRTGHFRLEKIRRKEQGNDGKDREGKPSQPRKNETEEEDKPTPKKDDKGPSRRNQRRGDRERKPEFMQDRDEREEEFFEEEAEEREAEDDTSAQTEELPEEGEKVEEERKPHRRKRRGDSRAKNEKKEEKPKKTEETAENASAKETPPLSDRKQDSVVMPLAEKPVENIPAPVEPAKPKGPPRKGWWQKMV